MILQRVTHFNLDRVVVHYTTHKVNNEGRVNIISYMLQICDITYSSYNEKTDERESSQEA